MCSATKYANSARSICAITSPRSKNSRRSADGEENGAPARLPHGRRSVRGEGGSYHVRRHSALGAREVVPVIPSTRVRVGPQGSLLRSPAVLQLKLARGVESHYLLTDRFQMALTGRTASLHEQ